MAIKEPQEGKESLPQPALPGEMPWKASQPVDVPRFGEEAEQIRLIERGEGIVDPLVGERFQQITRREAETDLAADRAVAGDRIRAQILAPRLLRKGRARCDSPGDSRTDRADV